MNDNMKEKNVPAQMLSDEELMQVNGGVKLAQAQFSQASLAEAQVSSEAIFESQVLMGQAATAGVAFGQSALAQGAVAQSAMAESALAQSALAEAQAEAKVYQTSIFGGSIAGIKARMRDKRRRPRK